jgi:hypothetical protein
MRSPFPLIRRFFTLRGQGSITCVAALTSLAFPALSVTVSLRATY